MLRVSFTLFNLQGTRSTAFQLSVRYILAHSFSLVKHFFRSFSLLTYQYSHSSLFALIEELVYFTTLFRVCQELFSSFFEVFSLESLDFSPFSTTSTLPSELIQFTTRFSLCQALFSSPARSPSSFRSVSSHFSTRFGALS